MSRSPSLPSGGAAEPALSLSKGDVRRSRKRAPEARNKDEPRSDVTTRFSVEAPRFSVVKKGTGKECRASALGRFARTATGVLSLRLKSISCDKAIYRQ